MVFDGYPPAEAAGLGEEGIEVIFSRKDSADERIKKIVESQANPKNIVVVSDDKEIKFFARASGSLAMAIEEFIPTAREKREKALKRAPLRREDIKAELNYSQMEDINRELKGLWLKS